MDSIDEYRFDGEFVLIAEDGGYWGKHEPSSYIMRGKFWVNNHAHVIRERDGVSNNLFLSCQLNFMDISPLIGGDARGKLTKSILERLPLVIPPLAEQQKIAEVLGLVQRALEQQARLIALTTELKKALLHQLFTQGLRGEPQKQTDIGPVPESWELRACDELCEMITVGVVVKPASHYVKSGVPAFRSMNVREDRLEVTELVYFSQETNDTILAKSKLQTGDVLIVRTGYPGTSCVVPEEYHGANCIDLVIARPQLKVIQSGFLSRFFNSDAGKRQALSAKHGLAQQHLNVGAVKRTLIPVPQLGEQREIDAALAIVERKLALHMSKHAALTALFRTLLHQLMTAEVRVHDVDLSDLGVDCETGDKPEACQPLAGG
ncbi:MAG: restriction endonuclease subunit S [Deltaproteobacteria bacterium]|nr:restriction endonuclease subunit S [Deltaproteobacteria bacterium]